MFGNRDEVGGRDYLAVTPPAYQRLGTDHAATAQADLGLVEQIELLVLQSLAQIDLHLHARLRIDVHLPGEEAVVAPAAVLGTIQRGIRILAHRIEVVAIVGIHADTDAE